MSESKTCSNSACIGGWLYSIIGGMSFPTNKRCPLCNPKPIDPNLKMPWVALAEYQCKACGEPLKVGSMMVEVRQSGRVLFWHPLSNCPHAEQYYELPTMHGEAEPTQRDAK